jgi:ATP-dependent Lon protease
MQTNLPVLLLRGLVLLPYSEIRIEITRDIDKEALKIAEQDHDNHILVVSQLDPLEENPTPNELPKIGTLAIIKMKMDIGNNKLRILVKGISRANVFNYNKIDNNVYDAIVGPVTQYEIDPKEELAYIRKLLKELEIYVNTIPYISNTVLAQINGITSAARLSDVAAFHLPTSLERKLEYLKMSNPIARIKMLLEDVRQEEEILELEQKIDIELKQQLDAAQKEYVLREKIRVIKEELGDVSSKDNDLEFIRAKMAEMRLPNKIRTRLNEELKRYESMPNTSPESGVIRNYIDWLISLPWNMYTKDNNDLENAKNILDRTHYGLEKVKQRIIEYLAVKQMTRNLRSPILCFVGPPGTGKTSLAKSVSKSLERNFVKISLGGVNDEAEIVGHRKTYIGSSPGRIIQAMKKSKASNPVFLIDELDKMTKDIKGDPAASLLEILDPEQNRYFSDHYIEEEFDLSKVLFIATANYLYDIPEPLRDRLEIVELSGYTEYEKLDIAKRHLIFKQTKEHGINKKLIKFSDGALLSIINNYTKEAGVRELERNIATIIRKIITDIISNKKIKINEIIYNIETSNLEEYLGKRKYFYTNNDLEDKIGVVNGLAYTSYGGDILPIEVTFYKGKGNLVLTGSLGEVMKESAQIALSYIKTHAIEFNIDYEKLETNDIHIHVPEGAIPKDGPSAGIALTTALISALTNQKIKHTIGMTGEITLRGNVLPIGGLKEKAIGAHRGGIKIIIIPQENERDLDEIPQEIKKDLIFRSVKHYQEVLDILKEV